MDLNVCEFYAHERGKFQYQFIDKIGPELQIVDQELDVEDAELSMSS